MWSHRATVIVAVALLSTGAAAQMMSASLARFLDAHRAAVVHMHSSKRFPNGAIADYYGSGFVVSSDGLVLTAAHVLDGIDRTTREFAAKLPTRPQAVFRYEGALGATDASREELQLVTLDDQIDVALLRFKVRRDFPYFQIASSDGLRASDQVLALGIPLGSSTIVPAVGRVTDISRPDGRWLFDAPVNPGHSGGPVIGRDGRVVGMVQAGLQGVTLMNVMLPFRQAENILNEGGVAQEGPLPLPAVVGGVPIRDKFDDIPLEGECATRVDAFNDSTKALQWICSEIVVPRGVAAHIEKARTVRVAISSSASIVDVRYFHRSRGDYRRPEEFGPWHTNPPDVDLQWMMVEKAEVLQSGDEQIIQAQCRNWSAELTMSCGIGVQYKVGARLW
jgi:hypothetical protein